MEILSKNSQEAENTSKETQAQPTPEQLKAWEEAEKTPLELNTNPNPKQIQSWENQYGNLKCFLVESEDGSKEYFYFKKVSLDHLRLANMELAATKDSIRYNEVIIKNCIINGISRIDDTEIFVALMLVVNEIITSKIAKMLKK